MRAIAILLSLAGAGAGQEMYRHTIAGTVLGATQPGTYAYAGSGPGAGFRYGFRPAPYVQFETGVDWISRPVGSALCCRFFENVQDNLFLVPVGASLLLTARRGRAALARGDDRWLVSIGAGAAYMRHAFGIDPAGYGYGAPVYSAWGPYGAAGVNYGFGHARRYRLGASGRFYVFGAGSGRPRVLAFGPEFAVRF